MSRVTKRWAATICQVQPGAAARACGHRGVAVLGHEPEGLVQAELRGGDHREQCPEGHLTGEEHQSAGEHHGGDERQRRGRSGRCRRPRCVRRGRRRRPRRSRRGRARGRTAHARAPPSPPRSRGHRRRGPRRGGAVVQPGLAPPASVVGVHRGRTRGSARTPSAPRRDRKNISGKISSQNGCVGERAQQDQHGDDRQQREARRGPAESGPRDGPAPGDRSPAVAGGR